LYYDELNEKLCIVIFWWLSGVVIFSAFWVGRTALQTLDEKQLRRFGVLVTIGLILDKFVDSLKEHVPRFWDKRAKNAEVTESEIGFYVALDLLLMALQLLLVIFAFVSAE